jgi:hypothetical protein
MIIRYHQGLTVERWQQLSLLEQLANVGSEVGRACKRQAEGKEEATEAALYRALELFDLTRQDPKNRTRLKEVGRAREVFLDFLVGENTYQSSPLLLDKYFMEYAVASRNRRN